MDCFIKGLILSISASLMFCFAYISFVKVTEENLLEVDCSNSLWPEDLQKLLWFTCFESESELRAIFFFFSFFSFLVQVAFFQT